MVLKFTKSFDNTKIYYDINKKSNKSLVFLHAWSHNHTVWNKELRYFQRKGYSILAPDLRGHGKSDKPEKLQDYHFNKFSKVTNNRSKYFVYHFE